MRTEADRRANARYEASGGRPRKLVSLRLSDTEHAAAAALQARYGAASVQEAIRRVVLDAAKEIKP